MKADLRVSVLGAGSAGQRHINNLQSLGAVVSVWRERAELADDLKLQYGVEVHRSAEEAIAAADAVVVATAPDQHLPLALAVARAGKPLFLEKPASHTANGLAGLAAAVGEGVAEVGCQLRFHPALRHLHQVLVGGGDGAIRTFRAAVGQRLSDWRPGSDWRSGFSANAARGGGALFELIHEIDLVRWLIGPTHSVVAELSDSSDSAVRCDVVANMILTTADGLSGQVQSDMVTPGYRRDFEIVLDEAVYRFDYTAGIVARSDPDDTKAVFIAPEGYQRNQMFLDHMQHFLRRASGETLDPGCSLADGIADVHTAIAARESAVEGCRVMVVGAA